jgi:hypothetical protein
MKDDIIRDEGLNRVAVSTNWTGTLKLAICRTEPTTLEHATEQEGTLTGKRVTEAFVVPAVNVTLADRGAGGREVTIPAEAAAANGLVNTTAGDDLWYALYDDAVLLHTFNESSDKAINNGDPVDFGQIKLGFGNDA